VPTPTFQTLIIYSTWKCRPCLPTTVWEFKTIDINFWPLDLPRSCIARLVTANLRGMPSCEWWGVSYEWWFQKNDAFAKWLQSKDTQAIAKHIEYFRKHINYLLVKLANENLALIVVNIFWIIFTRLQWIA
jgi:hypothetical protein